MPTINSKGVYGIDVNFFISRHIAQISNEAITKYNMYISPD